MRNSMSGNNSHVSKSEQRSRINTATLMKPTQTGPGSVSGGASKSWIGKPSTYYGIPLIKKAHWGWQIILYFFLGGIAGGSFLVATLADLFDAKKYASLIRSGRYLSFVCILASPVLLILDLGKPERFHHMLRVLKLRSVMSLGTWGLSTFGICCGFTTAHQMANDGLLNWFPPLARLLKALPVKVLETIGSPFGLFVASYTGVLLSSTAVPIWARARHILGPLFLTSGLSTALASLSLILSLGRNNEQTIAHLERAEIATMTTELGLLSALAPTLGPFGKPLYKGRLGNFFLLGTMANGVLVPLLIRLGWKVTRKATPRSANIALSLMVLVGGMILRYVWVVVGRASADDPQAVHDYNDIEWLEGKNRRK
jgi:formate-dependent nitrite reductase membrane component NrfD